MVRDISPTMGAQRGRNVDNHEEGEQKYARVFTIKHQSRASKPWISTDKGAQQPH